MIKISQRWLLVSHGTWPAVYWVKVWCLFDPSTSRPPPYVDFRAEAHYRYIYDKSKTNLIRNKICFPQNVILNAVSLYGNC